MNGKGSKRRPSSISSSEFADRIDDIFKKKNKVQVPVLQDKDGYFIIIPKKMLKKAGLNEGDSVDFTPSGDGYLVSKTLKLNK